MWSVGCEVQSVEWRVRSVTSEVWSVKCGVLRWSVKWRVRIVECEVWSVKCDMEWEVWRDACEMWSVK